MSFHVDLFLTYFTVLSGTITKANDSLVWLGRRASSSQFEGAHVHVMTFWNLCCTLYEGYSQTINWFVDILYADHGDTDMVFVLLR